MTKRFERVGTPSFVDMIAAFKLLGIEALLGAVGPHTAFTQDVPTNDGLTFHVVPGSWTGEELRDLVGTGFGKKSTPQVLSLAA